MRTILRFWLISTSVTAIAAFADVYAPVRLEALDLGDLGDFHGEIATNNEEGWGYWGGREPVVTTDWVIFPWQGTYSFIIEASSQQFVPADTESGIFAEVDLRARVDGHNGTKKLAENLADFQSDELMVLHTRIKADWALGEWFTEPVEAGTVDPEDALVITDDRLTGRIDFDEGMKVQLGVYFTNDRYEETPLPIKDRNMRLRALVVIAPEGAIVVDPTGNATTSWGLLKEAQ